MAPALDAVPSAIPFPVDWAPSPIAIPPVPVADVLVAELLVPMAIDPVPCAVTLPVEVVPPIAMAPTAVALVVPVEDPLPNTMVLVLDAVAFRPNAIAPCCEAAAVFPMAIVRMADAVDPLPIAIAVLALDVALMAIPLVAVPEHCALAPMATADEAVLEMIALFPIATPVPPDACATEPMATAPPLPVALAEDPMAIFVETDEVAELPIATAFEARLPVTAAEGPTTTLPDCVLFVAPGPIVTFVFAVLVVKNVVPSICSAAVPAGVKLSTPVFDNVDPGADIPPLPLLVKICAVEPGTVGPGVNGTPLIVYDELLIESVSIIVADRVVVSTDDALTVSASNDPITAEFAVK